MLQSGYDKEQRHKRLKILLIILTALMVGVILFVTVKFGREYLSNSMETMTGVPSKDADTPKSFPEPAKIEFVDRFPTDFPADIPVEKEFKLTQSYTLDYPDQKQLSIVFPSMKTVKENFAFYSDYVKKEGWTIVNQEEGDSLSFLYATKEGMEMNITITETDPNASNSILLPTDTKEKSLPPATSQVSVSVLKK